MSLLGGAIVEAVVMEYGRGELLRRLSDPFWFQSLGCVLGMDWHSSGITTSVMNALKKSVNLRSSELGVYICGGRGRSSRQTPAELLDVAERTGLDGEALVRCSRLSAKVDNTAVQDGFQLYLHSFVVTAEGDWAVIQQGMNPAGRMARRYHWLSSSLESFTQEPHASVCGLNQGLILNLTYREAAMTKEGILELTRERPDRLLHEAALVMPCHHEVTAGGRPADAAVADVGQRGDTRHAVAVHRPGAFLFRPRRQGRTSLSGAYRNLRQNHRGARPGHP